jgi:hypothetical protein
MVASPLDAAFIGWHEFPIVTEWVPAEPARRAAASAGR